MNVGDLVSWNNSGNGLFHLVDSPSYIHDDEIEDYEEKITGIVMNYYGDNPGSPDADGHVKILWNDGTQTITSVGLLVVLNKC